VRQVWLSCLKARAGGPFNSLKAISDPQVKLALLDMAQYWLTLAEPLLRKTALRSLTRAAAVRRFLDSASGMTVGRTVNLAACKSGPTQ
jgi:hypothetical protein